MRYIVFDCETTGLSPLLGDRICEIGAVKLEGDRIVDKYWSLVNPEREVGFEAYMVNKITNEMLKDAPKMDEVLPSFLEFLGEDKLVAYNASFDLSFLNTELLRYGYSPIARDEVIDIYILARKLLPDLGLYPLWNVAKRLKVPVITSHRALADAQTAAEVFIKLLKAGGDKILDMAHLDYGDIIKEIKRAIKMKGKIRLKYLTDEGETREKVVKPIAIEEVAGEEFLRFEEEKGTSIILISTIEEVKGCSSPRL